jgi:hypothetical protein
MMGAFRS